MNINQFDTQFSPEVGFAWKIWDGPGYHTRVPNGVPAYAIRENMDYILLLLASDEPWRIDRANTMLLRILALQSVDPTDSVYGIWPWLAEEPLDKMNPPDWNWADFIGVRLARILRDHPDRLRPDVLEQCRSALGHAAMSIFRRNVQPSYTNIAIMGAGVTLAAGELLEETRLLHYGRLRLQKIVDHVQRNGELDEYNSPAYTVVAIEECDNVLRLVQDADARRSAEWLRWKAWLTLAEHYHPATGQWAGPHSRSYHDLIDPQTIPMLMSRAPGCPPDLLEKFDHLSSNPTYFTKRFLDLGDEERSIYGTTWLSDASCLASANHEILWHQRRPLIGYWKTGSYVAVLRLRFLVDGRDFSSASVRCVQDHNQVLTAIHLVTECGGFHPYLNRPSDGRFQASDIRVRWQVEASGASVQQISSNLFRLASGPTSADITVGASVFGGCPVQWETGREGDVIYVDGICQTGSLITFHPAEVAPVFIVSAVRLTDASAPVDEISMVITETDAGYQARWGNLSLRSPSGSPSWT